MISKHQRVLMVIWGWETKYHNKLLLPSCLEIHNYTYNVTYCIISAQSIPKCLRINPKLFDLRDNMFYFYSDS